jgi:formylglycine-generating enzyme required for sulfatase activity
VLPVETLGEVRRRLSARALRGRRARGAGGSLLGRRGPRCQRERENDYDANGAFHVALLPVFSLQYSPFMRACAVTALGAFILAAGLLEVPLIGQHVQLETILARATHYVGEFVYRFANVVAEERYSQESISNRLTQAAPAGVAPGSPIIAGSRRELRSDFLLVLLPESDEYQPFRDVFEVDGAPIRDREQRLTKLFLESKSAAVDQARKISLESARYNLGNVARTFNNPIIPLAFLQPNGRPRFRFSLGKQDRTAGPNVWIVEYREQGRPTLIKGLRGRDIPARGAFWIDADTGRVLRSTLQLNDPAVLATLTTTYRTDERFQIDVPVEMRETYVYGGTRVLGTATYGRFRRFDVSTDETVTSAAPATIITERRTGLTLVEIRPGRFKMGSPAAETGRTAAERQHETTMSRSFLLGQREVTQQEWRALLGDRPSRFSDCGPRCPVESVAFEDVQRFLAALNGAQTLQEYRYRLPTEAEWEYACRAGTTTPFSTGGTISTLLANFNGKEPYEGAPSGLFRERPTRAGGFAPNPWGLSDMHGNVAEWTSDRLVPDESAGPAPDPGAPLPADALVIRGGSWASGASAIRCAARSGVAPATRDPRIGFRVAADRIGETP